MNDSSRERPTEWAAEELSGHEDDVRHIVVSQRPPRPKLVLLEGGGDPDGGGSGY
ncbi:hypothetical protein GCM10010441_39660 [Kitasatospora paracochleata]|uniref:Uncharacterized protein n=1 Tax=Kitasatospora paracochleata TaxID=58354 RepID=A0ABT1IWI4_9ACTN|nr:hypothetical protein [Kitasatospora paracochleata]MCP2309314.1 hypothetical protein [Kitasatospora paracochleata]